MQGEQQVKVLPEARKSSTNLGFSPYHAEYHFWHKFILLYISFEDIAMYQKIIKTHWTSVVQTSCLHCMGYELNPWLGNQDLDRAKKEKKRSNILRNFFLAKLKEILI